MIIVDTDVLIDFLAGVDPVRRQIAAYLDAGQIETTVINAFELLSGARQDTRGHAVRTLVGGLPVLPLERNSAERAAVVRQQLEQTGESIGMADSLIAGIALTHSLPLFTRNRRHFEKVATLKLIDVATS